MKDFLYFFSFQDANIRHVVFGCVVLGGSSALVGAFSFLRKQSLVGDAVAHALLPGICLAFIWKGEKNFWVLLIGAFVSGMLSLQVMEVLSTYSKLKKDTIIALVLSTFFGIGISLLTYIQRSPLAAQSGLNSFLFGKAAGMLSTDVWMFLGVSVFLLLTLQFFLKEFMLICFDETYAKSLGLPVRLLKQLLVGLTVLCIVLGIQAVGVVLVAALLVIPAATARFWTHYFHMFLLLSAGLGMLGGLTGAYVSYTAPHMPTGPWIVLMLALCAGLSFLGAPKRGLIHRYYKLREQKRKTIEENILKTLYKCYEKDETPTLDTLDKYLSLSRRTLSHILHRLKARKYVLKVGVAWALSKLGVVEARQVVRKHRLWELYLAQHLDIPIEDVHEKAERIEHLLDQTLSEDLDTFLSHPRTDPHHRDIPS